ncbi:MAG: hypothetical protein H3Z52_16360 [archaeon]|nr:hypothetical protein [archaeon]
MEFQYKDWILEASDNQWRSAREISDRIIKNHPGINISGQCLSMPLNRLKNQGLMEDDGAKWPTLKRWRKTNKDFLEQVAEALMDLGLTNSREESLKYLARKEVEAKQDTYTKLIQKAEKLKIVQEEVKKELEKA